jgi:GT2 family glycosyltransferase
MFDLSIVIPTCNRAEFLRRNLESLRRDVRCSFEVIVVDGASIDGTAQVLADAGKDFGDRLKVIREERREGFVRAANKGFAAATGRNMIWLNDDSLALPGTLDEAVRQVDLASPEVAFLAMFHRFASERNLAAEVVREGLTFRLCHIRGTLYANFPIGKRETYQKLGYFDERFYFYGADPDLSLKAWHAGMRVEPAQGCFIDHDEHDDERRALDADRGREDNQKLFAKWDLPEKNLSQNDFDPGRPCTLRGLRAEVPTVTFLLSTFNRRNTLLTILEKLKSLGNSADFISETIVVDNASSDGTADAVAGEFPSVHLVRQKKNRGACAKNAGLAEASGEYIVFLDDDSYPDVQSIRRMIEHFRDDPRLGAAVFDVVLPNGQRECSAFPAVCIGCGTGFRREALLAVKGLPDDFFMQAEEYDLSLRILDAGWDVRRFEDIRVHHLKTAHARQPARTTRLDTRNNLLVIARRFPRKWVWPYAVDWMRRYWWIANNRDWRHRVAFWRGLIEGAVKSLWPGRRRPVSDGAFEKFAMIDQIRNRLARAGREGNIRSIVLIDVGKNIYAYWLAAKQLNLPIVAIADSNLARPKRRYRGIPVLDDAAARRLYFDAAIVANMSPVHSLIRTSEWRSMERRPVIDLFESAQIQSVAA